MPELYKLGKRPARIDDRTLAFADYAKGKLTPAPMGENLTSKITDLGMMLNDSLGDCTCAAVGHCIQQWTAENGAQVIVSDDAILSLYEAVGGYVPGDESTDNGAVCLDVLNYWRKHGVANSALKAYVSLNPKDGQEVTDAIYYFGNMYVGVELPISAQNADEWVVPEGGATGDGAPGSWGGHCVPVVAYACDGLYVITWGQLMKMSWDFLRAYCDEAYALLSPDWLEFSGKSPEGFDFTQLKTDLEEITGK